MKEEKEQELRTFTWAEVEEEKEKRSLIIVLGKVYDVSKWKERHPGGPLLLELMNGRDATDPFLAYHSQSAQNLLQSFCVGKLDKFELTPLQKDYHALLQKVEQDGLTKPAYLWYFCYFAILLSTVFTTVLCVLYGESLAVHLFGAVLLGMFWQQLSFLGHDFGHKGVFHDRYWDTLGGVIVTGLMGVSGAWWRRVHNAHHVTTNSESHDPDIQYLPLFAVNKKACKDYFSFFHNRWFYFDKAARFLIAHQHILYLPILSVARFNLYALSWHHVYRKDIQQTPDAYMERYSLIFYAIWNILLLSQLPDPLTTFLFLLISHQFCGIVHVQIILSHFPMETYQGLGYKPGDREFVKMQVATSLDVDCVRWMDWFHGGLQFQVEHHLFPRVSRPRLRYVMENIVVPLCKKHNLQHHNYDFIEGNLMVYRSMREAAMLTRKMKMDPKESFLWRLLCAEG